MAEMRIPLDYHTGGGVRVEPQDDGSGDVILTLDPEHGEGRAASRMMRPDEARAVAAALNHFAAEARP